MKTGVPHVWEASAGIMRWACKNRGCNCTVVDNKPPRPGDNCKGVPETLRPDYSAIPSEARKLLVGEFCNRIRMATGCPEVVIMLYDPTTDDLIIGADTSSIEQTHNLAMRMAGQTKQDLAAQAPLVVLPRDI